MPHKEDILVLKVNADKYVHLLIRFLFDSGVTPQLLSAECDRRNLLLTHIVRCVVNTCGMTQKPKGGEPVSYSIGDIPVRLRYLAEAVLFSAD